MHITFRIILIEGARNEVLREELEAESIYIIDSEKQQLKLFGHLQRIGDN